MTFPDNKELERFVSPDVRLSFPQRIIDDAITKHHEQAATRNEMHVFVGKQDSDIVFTWLEDERATAILSEFSLRVTPHMRGAFALTTIPEIRSFASIMMNNPQSFAILKQTQEDVATERNMLAEIGRIDQPILVLAPNNDIAMFIVPTSVEGVAVSFSGRAVAQPDRPFLATAQDPYNLRIQLVVDVQKYYEVFKK